MQVVTYEGHQVCTIKYPGKALQTTPDLAVAVLSRILASVRTALCYASTSQGVTTDAEQAEQNPTAVVSVHHVLLSKCTPLAVFVCGHCHLHACRDAY